MDRARKSNNSKVSSVNRFTEAMAANPTKHNQKPNTGLALDTSMIHHGR